MQKPLRIQFLAFCFLFFVSSFAACKFNPNLQGQGESYLQGEWQQDTVPLQKQLVNYSLYHLTFNCDSFFVSMKTFSRANSGADSCTKSGSWTEYAKGVYDQKSDTLHVRGLFCNADYSYKDPTGCFRSGVYEERFKVSKKTGSVVQFSSTSSVIPFNAHLIKKISCIPKPL